MSGQRKQNDDEKQQTNKIDDPDMFISLDYPKNDVEEPQFEDHSQQMNDENQIVDQQADNQQQEQKSEEQVQQNQQAGFQQQAEKTQQQYLIRLDQPQNEVLQKPQPITNKADLQFEPKINAKKKKKSGKRRELQSSEDSYSGGQFTVKKKGKSKESKKMSVKKSQSTRGRGKPRGRGAAQSRISQVKKEDTKNDYVFHEKTEKAKINQNAKKIQTPSNSAVINNIQQQQQQQQLLQQQLIPLNWKTAEIDAEQDLDSQNASIFSESVNKRQNSSLYNQMLSLIGNNSGNLIESIAALAPLWYTTLN